MSLIKYNELRNKIINQMQDQVKEVKTTAVEQWAKDNGFGTVYFENYEEAQRWVDENINSNKKYKKDFYTFEGEVDDTTSALMEELEAGSSSSFEKTLKTISSKYVSPAIKTLVKSAAINFIVTQGVGLGLSLAGAKAHEWAAHAIADIDLDGDNKDNNFIDNVVDGIDFMNLRGKTEDTVKDGLNGVVDSINGVYKDKLIPFAQRTTSAVLGFFQARGIIRNARTDQKITELNAENESQSNMIEELKDQVVELKRDQQEDSLIDKVERKRDLVIKNVGKVQQMNYIVGELKSLFKDEGINIPDIPDDCFTMEEYGTFLRNSLKNQNLSNEKCQEVYDALDIYKNNIGKITKDLRMGKGGVIQRTKDSIDRGLKDIGKSISDTVNRTTITIRQTVNNALGSGISKEEVDKMSYIKTNGLVKDI